MIKINLVPEVQEKKVAQEKFNHLVTVISGSLIGGAVIALVLLSGLIVANNAMISGNNKKITEVEGSLVQYKELEETVLSLEAGLTAAKQALSGKYAWTKLLTHLEAATPSEVTFTGLGLKSGQITAQLDAPSIDSLARFADSYKNYGVITVSGQANNDTEVKIAIDDGEARSIKAKDGAWNISLPTSINSNHDILVTVGDQSNTYKYNGVAKTIIADSEGVGAIAKTIFTNVNVSEYQKEGSGVKFGATMDFDGGLIW